MELDNISGLSRLRNTLSSASAALAQSSRPTLNPAEWAYERLVEYIKDFEEDLDDEHEIGARLVSFGSVVTFHIQNLGYYGPDIISFDGQDEQGQRVKLIQNISQLNVLLIAMKKIHEEPRRLGFILSQDKKDDEEE